MVLRGRAARRLAANRPRASGVTVTQMSSRAAAAPTERRERAAPVGITSCTANCDCCECRECQGCRYCADSRRVGGRFGGPYVPTPIVCAAPYFACGGAYGAGAYGAGAYGPGVYGGGACTAVNGPFPPAMLCTPEGYGYCALGAQRALDLQYAAADLQYAAMQRALFGHM